MTNAGESVTSFERIVHTAILRTPIDQLLDTGPAVVLERLARGGGATRWYYCPDRAQLTSIERELRPGSVVSFYFDERIRNGVFSPEMRSDCARILVESGELVIGRLAGGETRIDAEVVTGPSELEEFASGIGPSSRVFYGVFPARDNDGSQAVTLTVPDLDGTTRSHPH